MRELLLTVAITLAGLVAIDLALSYWTAPLTGEQEIDIERDEAFDIIARNQVTLLGSAGRDRFDEVVEGWQNLASEKRDGEFRVFLVGNSAAIFALVPERIKRVLTQALPERRPVVIPLLLPGIKVLDEAVLIEAALARGADVVVLTPNLKGLQPGPSPSSAEIQQHFDAEQVGSLRERSLADRFRDHWLLYRERERIRARIRSVIPTQLGGRGLHDQGRALDEIADAAAGGDVELLLDVYAKHDMGVLLMGAALLIRKPKDASVFDTVRKNAEMLERSDAIAVAIYMPMNPLLRNSVAMREHPGICVDDTYVRWLGEKVMASYSDHGFHIADRLDALPAEAFVDAVHVNGRGSRIFSDEAAAIIAEAVRATARGVDSAGRPAHASAPSSR